MPSSLPKTKRNPDRHSLSRMQKPFQHEQPEDRRWNRPKAVGPNAPLMQAFRVWLDRPDAEGDATTRERIEIMIKEGNNSLGFMLNYAPDYESIVRTLAEHQFDGYRAMIALVPMPLDPPCTNSVSELMKRGFLQTLSSDEREGLEAMLRDPNDTDMRTLVLECRSLKQLWLFLDEHGYDSANALAAFRLQEEAKRTGQS